MFAIRELSGRIAGALGRPESEGWIFTRYFQQRGIFPIGRGGRGGAGAPRATHRDALYLLVALSVGLPPMQAVDKAIDLLGLDPAMDVLRLRALRPFKFTLFRGVKIEIGALTVARVISLFPEDEPAKGQVA